MTCTTCTEKDALLREAEEALQDASQQVTNRCLSTTYIIREALRKIQNHLAGAEVSPPIVYRIEPTKPLDELVAGDIPRGLDPDDFADD